MRIPYKGTSNGGGYTSPGDRDNTGYTGNTGTDWMPGDLTLPPIISGEPRMNAIEKIIAYPGIEQDLKIALKSSTEGLVSLEEAQFLLEVCKAPANYYEGEKSVNAWVNELIRSILGGKDIEAAKQAATVSMNENPYVSKEEDQKAQDLIKQVQTTKQSGITFLVMVGILIYFILRK
jgi:hypothetical protein